MQLFPSWNNEGRFCSACFMLRRGFYNECTCTQFTQTVGSESLLTLLIKK